MQAWIWQGHLQRILEIIENGQVDAIDAAAVVCYPGAYTSWTSQCCVLQREVAPALQWMRDAAWLTGRVF